MDSMNDSQNANALLCSFMYDSQIKVSTIDFRMLLAKLTEG